MVYSAFYIQPLEGGVRVAGTMIISDVVVSRMHVLHSGIPIFSPTQLFMTGR